MSIDNLLKEGIEQVMLAGITPGNIDPKVKVNNRAVKRFGQCEKLMGNKYDYKIEINAKLLNAKKEKIMNTIVHEILHTCKGCMNHGATWQKYASIMNDEFDYDISRTTSYEKIGIERPKPKYIVECKSCGNQFHRQKKSKLITDIHLYKCSCGGKLKLS